jgi:hypothetical protein
MALVVDVLLRKDSRGRQKIEVIVFQITDFLHQNTLKHASPPPQNTQ